MRAKVRIEMTGPRQGKVWVDDVEQTNVVALSMDVDVRKGEDIPCRVLITQAIYPSALEIEGEMDVTTLANLGARMYVGPAKGSG